MLTAWHSATTHSGHALPEPAELVGIADRGSVHENDSRTARQWQATIDHLLKQAMFGVTWTAITLDNALRSPVELLTEDEGTAGPEEPAATRKDDPELAGSSADPQTQPASRSDRHAAQADGGAGGATSPAMRDSNEPRFAALLAWRAQAVADGRLAEGAATDIALGHLARSNISEPRDVARRARNLEPFAQEIVELLSGAGSVGASVSTRADTEAADAPVAVHAGVRAGTSSSSQAASAGREGRTPSVPEASAGGGVREPAAPIDELEERVQDLVLGQLPTTHAIALQPSSGRIDLEVQGDGAQLAWVGRGDAEVTVYRLVLGDGERPLQPEDGETLTLTSRPRTRVAQAAGVSVLSYLQVWAYAGDSFDEAVGAQPELIAERSVVTPVTEVQFSAEPGWVTLSWTAPEGASSVRVYRYVGDRAPKHDTPANLVGSGATNLIGISDAPPTTVPTLVYRAVVAIGTGEATQLSEPVDTVVSMPTRLEPVTDLELVLVAPVEGNQAGQVDLRFTRPAVGKVWVYRLTEPLVGGVAGRQFPLHALPSAGLTDERRRHGRLGSPDDTGRVTMEGLQLPPGEPLLTFVPVTVLGDDAAVGTPARHVGIGIPGDPRLRDRVHEQVITFGWPAGATEVHLFPVNPGDDEAEVTQGRPAAQIDEIQYERDGGWRLALSGIHHSQDYLLVGIKGARHRGAPARVTYDPLLVLEYGLATGKTKAMFGQVRTTVAFWRCSGEASGRPPFMVVHHPTRLPLTPLDGTPLPLVPDATPEAPPAAEARPEMTATNAAEAEKFRIAAPIPPGYLRAFLSSSVPAEVRTRVALLDPPIASLRIRA